MIDITFGLTVDRGWAVAITDTNGRAGRVLVEPFMIAQSADMLRALGFRMPPPLKERVFDALLRL
jgi:hypothetical protein